MRGHFRGLGVSRNDVMIHSSPIQTKISGPLPLAMDNPGHHRPLDPALMITASAFRGRRDPFRLPPPPLPASKKTNGLPVYLPPGARGLLINQLDVEGIVADGPKMLAVVTNQSGVAYFLRDDETLYDGYVSRITPEAVYFIERVRSFGHPDLFRSVVKRLGSAEGEKP